MTRILAFLILIFVTPAFADTGGGQNLEQVMNALSKIHNAHARFVERKYLKMLDAPVETSGILNYTAPDQLEKITTAPEPEHFDVKGDQLTIQQGDDTHVLMLADYPQIATFVESMRATLQGNLTTLNQYYSVGFDGNLSSWQLLLEPKDESVAHFVRWVRISGTQAIPHTIETMEGDGDRAELTITMEKQN